MSGRLPVDRQYRGTQNSEVVTKPAPFSRAGAGTKVEAGSGDGILAKDPEERRVDSATGQLKLAEAGLEAIKTAAKGRVIRQRARQQAGQRRAAQTQARAKQQAQTQKVSPAEQRRASSATRKSNATPPPKTEQKTRTQAKTDPKAKARTERPKDPGQAGANAAKSAPTSKQFVGSDGTVYHHDAQGRIMIPGADGKPRYPQGGPGSFDDLAMRQHLGGMSNMDRHRLMTQSVGADGAPLARDSRMARWGARGADILQNPVAQMIAPMAAQSAMSLIPAGTDEYGNRRSLADTTAGQIGSMALPFAAPMAYNRFGGGGRAMAAMTAPGPKPPVSPLHAPPPSHHPVARAGTTAVTKPAPTAPPAPPTGTGTNTTSVKVPKPSAPQGQTGSFPQAQGPRLSLSAAANGTLAQSGVSAVQGAPKVQPKLPPIPGVG